MFAVHWEAAMTTDISTKTQLCDVTIGISQGSRRSLHVAKRVVLVGIVAAIMSTLALPLYAKDSVPMIPAAINPTLPGVRVGTLTKAQGTTLFIDRTAYSLAQVAMVEDRFGTPLSIRDLQCNDVQYRVQYWTAPELGPDQILQLIVTFPE